MPVGEPSQWSSNGRSKFGWARIGGEHKASLRLCIASSCELSMGRQPPFCSRGLKGSTTLAKRGMKRLHQEHAPKNARRVFRSLGMGMFRMASHDLGSACMPCSSMMNPQYETFLEANLHFFAESVRLTERTPESSFSRSSRCSSNVGL